MLVFAIRLVRITLFAVLALAAPIILGVLSVLAGGGILASFVYFLADLPSHRAPYAALLGFSGACVALLAIYSRILNRTRRR